MAEAPLSLGLEYFPEFIAGRPVAGGFVYVGTEKLDPEILANRVDVLLLQSDGTKVTIAPASQPLTIGSGGVISYLGSPAFIRVTGAVSIKITDSIGAQIYYNPTANISAGGTTNEGALVQNGSFENETIVAGLPDNWLTVPGSNGTVAIDPSSQAHGLKSLKFTGTDATGGGTATSDKFNVLSGGDLTVRFAYKSSAVNTLNKVDIKYYDASGTAISTVSILSEGAANPAVYTAYSIGDTSPATAAQVEIILTGIDGAGVTVVGSTNFDNIVVDIERLDFSTSIIAIPEPRISIGSLSFPAGRAIEAEVSLIRVNGASVNYIHLALNYDYTDANYNSVIISSGTSTGATNNPRVATLDADGDTLCFQMTLIPSITTDETLVIIQGSKWNPLGAVMKQFSSSSRYKISSTITSIEIRNSSGSSAFDVGSTLRVRLK